MSKFIILSFAIGLSLTFHSLNASEIFNSKMYQFRVTEVAGELKNPWGLAFLPSGEILVTENVGKLKLVSASGKITNELEGGPKVSKCGQGGLMDIALHPQYELNQLI